MSHILKDGTVQKVKMLADASPVVTRIIPDLAVEIGLNESIMLLQIGFWIDNSDNLRNGQYWTYQSVRDMQKKAFPYWGVATINRTIKNLEKKGLIVIGNYNKKKYDKTRWFALNIDALSKLQSITLKGVSKRNEVFHNETGPFQNGTASSDEVFQNGTTIPETPTEKTPETTQKDSVPDGTADETPSKEELDNIFDAIREVWKIGQGGWVGKLRKFLMGQCDPKDGDWYEYQIDPGMTADEIREFGEWYHDSEETGDVLPQKPIQIEKYVLMYREAKATIAKYPTPYVLPPPDPDDIPMPDRVREKLEKLLSS